jgi:hypothetical protein
LAINRSPTDARRRARNRTRTCRSRRILGCSESVPRSPDFSSTGSSITIATPCHISSLLGVGRATVPLSSERSALSSYFPAPLPGRIVTDLHLRFQRRCAFPDAELDDPTVPALDGFEGLYLRRLICSQGSEVRIPQPARQSPEITVEYRSTAGSCCHGTRL